jgi:hypothetical protein
LHYACWTVEYESEFPLLREEDRHFSAIGVEQALTRYAWPSRLEALENIEVFPFIQGQIADLYDWDSNRTALNYLRAGLRIAMLAGSDEQARNWCEAILRGLWGIDGARRSSNCFGLLNAQTETGYVGI